MSSSEPLKPGDIVYLRGVVMQITGGGAGKNVIVNLIGPGGAMIPFVTPKDGSHIERVGPA